MAAKPVLDGIALQQVQEIEGSQEEMVNQHQVPALEGDFLQRLGRRAGRIRLRGILTGPDAVQSVETLRQKFRTAKPVTFVADIASATKVGKVLIEEMGIRELAGKPGRFEYAFTLVEFLSGTQAASKPSKLSAPPLPKPGAGTVALEATGSGTGRVDVRHAVAMLEGTTLAGKKLHKTLNRSGGIWTETGIPAGQYTVKIVIPEPAMAGTGRVRIRPAQTSRVQITPRPATVALGFSVHFAHSKAFLEPGMFAVLREAAKYSHTHFAAKIVVTGHTDGSESPEKAQILSAERARAVFACLTQGGMPDSLGGVWSQLRRASSDDPERAWSRREYQSMLQDLGYFPGQLNNDSSLTDRALRDFQLDSGLLADGVVDDNTWGALIDAYVRKNSFSLSKDRFLSPPWQGWGDQAPIENTRHAARANRRAEILFVASDALPQARNRWVILPPQTGTVAVRGSIRREDGSPAAGLKYVLAAPDGHYMDGEQPDAPERGSPIPGRTATDGTFLYVDEYHQTGIYVLEVIGPYVARLPGDAGREAKGPVVWKRLDDESSSFDVMITRQ
jgi:outer membrane protein OmpA-like peptidoglycan-associated protein